MQYFPLLFIKVLYSSLFPVTSDDGITECSYVDICLRFSPLSNIYCVLVGIDCNVSKTPNNENEPEELAQSLKQYMCLKSAAHHGAKQEGSMD
jgi:hypothetical protein